MIKPIPGIWYAADVLNGQRPFPTFSKERKGEGFKEVLDKAIERPKVERCESCSRYDHKRDRMRNRLYCLFSCEEYKTETNLRAIAYNEAVVKEMEKGEKNGKTIFESG